MRYQVRLFDPASGAVRQMVAEAADESSLRSTLGATGEVVVGLRPQGGATRLLARARPKRFDVGLLCMELSRLLRAGLTLPEAMETQFRRVQGPARAVYAGLQARLLEGKRLSEAMRLVGEFPPVLTR